MTVDRHDRLAVLARLLLDEFHAERASGETVMVARMTRSAFTAAMNTLGSIERERAAGDA